MSKHSSFSLVVPLWNEGKNVEKLVETIEASGLPTLGMSELILVNNGSTDETERVINILAQKFPWIYPLHLSTNQNYGGGIFEGSRYAKSDVIGWIPGDLQVSAEDVLKIWEAFKSEPSTDKLIVKGVRTVRHDGWQTKFVSAVYTSLANFVLNVGIKDINGLPKMFSSSLLNELPAERMITFMYDVQLISLARVHGYTIKEIPVTFHARRAGVSSWSGKRMRVYFESLKSLFRLRALRFAPAVGINRVTRPEK